MASDKITLPLKTNSAHACRVETVDEISMNMTQKTALTLCVIAAGACALLLTSCSDNKPQDPTPTAKEGKQTTGESSAPREQAPTAPPSAAPEQASSAGGSSGCDALLTTKCTECHNTTRICEKLGKKSKARWQRTLERMTERGAKVNPEEAATLLRCLDGGTTELQASCR